jgi:hypothetical protein
MFNETPDRLRGRMNLIESAEVAGAGAKRDMDIEAEGPLHLTFGLLLCGDTPH